MKALHIFMTNEVRGVERSGLGAFCCGEDQGLKSPCPWALQARKLFFDWLGDCQLQKENKVLVLAWILILTHILLLQSRVLKIAFQMYD